MFLVSDSLDNRARVIRHWLNDYPSIALVVAATYFEWTICRAISRTESAIKHGYTARSEKSIWS